MSERTVLIVDDHEGFRAVVRAVLVRHGFDVVGESADGQGALAAAAELGPAIVLLDVRLPDLDGFEVARRLLAGRHAPAVVLVSTREAADYGGRISASGALGFITKSRLSGDTLLGILRTKREGRVK